MIIAPHGLSNNPTKCRTNTITSSRPPLLSPKPRLHHVNGIANGRKVQALPPVEDAYFAATDILGVVENVPGAADVVVNGDISAERQQANGHAKRKGDAEGDEAAADGGQDVRSSSSASSSESLADSLAASSLGDEYVLPKNEVYVPTELCPLGRITKKQPAMLKPLTLMDVWVVDVPARHTVTIFDFAKRHNLQDSKTCHLKRVKRPGAKATVVTILLCSVEADSQADVRIAGLLSSDPLVGGLGPFVPYRLSVPATQAESTQQLAQWGEIWPITYIPLHAGPRGHLLPRRWTQEHVDWARRGLQAAAAIAQEAKAKGELPIACLVANNFDTRSADEPPVELTRSFDTRTSTGNTLCHSFRNLIAAVADLDRRGVRSGPITPPTASGATLPYLLTGMTLFATHEPCLLCSMALLHSRVQYLIYAIPSQGAGGCGTLYDVHEDEGLNHKFEVWHWKEPVAGLEAVACDP